MNRTSLTASAQHPPSGRDELNLIDFPIGVLQYQQPLDEDGRPPAELVCTVESFDKHVGQVVPRTLTRRTSSKYGFPTPLEDDVLVGLLTLTRLKTNFESPRVSFRNGELYDLIRWPHNGASNRRLSIALDRLQGLTLKYENSWTTNDGEFEKEFTTGLLDSYEIVKPSQHRDADDRGESSVVWASEVFADIQRGNVKELNTDRFFSLDLPIARRLYRFLDKHLREQPHFEIDLVTLAAHLGISGTRHIGKIKERLRKSLQKLEHAGDLIRPAAQSERYRKQGRGQWLAVFDRVSLEYGTQDQTKTPSRDSRSRQQLWKANHGDSPARQLVSAFYEKWSGDTHHIATRNELSQAQTLVARYGTEHAIALVPKLVRIMKQAFPQARAFGATLNYWHEADKAGQQLIRTTKPETEVVDDSQRQVDRQQLESQRQQWAALSEQKQNRIRDRVAQSSSDTVRRFIAEKKFDDLLVERACLAEMLRTAA